LIVEDEVLIAFDLELQVVDAGHRVAGLSVDNGVLQGRRAGLCP